MKTFSKILATLTTTLLLAAGSAFAATSYESAYVDGYKGRSSDIPVPVSVVSPSIVGDYQGTHVVVTFTVDASGKPRDISVDRAADAKLSRSLTDAVAEWKFEPARSNGTPVAKTVALPLVIE